MYNFKSGQSVSIKTKKNFNKNISERDNFKKLDSFMKKDISVDKKMNVFDELFINASHELRTPLNIIYSAVQLIELYMKDDLENDSVDKIETNVISIKRNSLRLMKLINNILDLNKADSGLLNLNYSYVNIIEVVENVVQNVSGKVNDKQLSIIFDTDIEEKCMQIDIEAIQRVLLNLMSNAVKFSKQEGKIFVKVTVENNSIDISVTDTGIGIDKSHIKSIFKKFSQVDKSLSGTKEGSGIGLKLSELLIKAHGGSISASSIINEGSTFIVSLPCSRNDNIYNLYSRKVLYFDSLKEMTNIEFSDVDRVDIS
ncbi:MAG: phoR2 [Sedimentibacter sp.]|jgi:methyl-accepting chemotaxis protein|nr:phoR2 [Sedimentibacter sp.]